MKPAILIKTVKGHKYLQLRNAEGQLTHLGPADKKQTWTLAYHALDMEYSALAMREMFSYEHLAEGQGVNMYEALNDVSEVEEKWRSLAKKKHVESALSHAMLRSRFRIGRAELEKIAEKADMDFQVSYDAAQTLGVAAPLLIFTSSKEGFVKLADGKVQG